MFPNPAQISGLGPFSTTIEKLDPHTTRTLFRATPASTPGTKSDPTSASAPSSSKPFLIQHKSTIELRTDPKLSRLLQSKYESVMQSRYFGRGGIEIVLSGQLPASDLADLIRLSYRLTTGAA